MSVGDLILWYGRKTILGEGRVLTKANSFDLANELWGEKEQGLTWENIFITDQLNLLDIPVSNFNQFAGNAPNFFYYGFYRCKPERVNKILSGLDLGFWNTANSIDVTNFAVKAIIGAN